MAGQGPFTTPARGFHQPRGCNGFSPGWEGAEILDLAQRFAWLGNKLIGAAKADQTADGSELPEVRYRIAL